MHLDTIKNLTFAPTVQRFEIRDTLLYALGLGYGSDPMDESDLRFVYEESLRALPSMVSVLGHPGSWLEDPRFGIDWVNVLHAEQAFTIHSVIPTQGEVRSENTIVGVEDKGAGKGALLHVERNLFDARSGARLAVVRSSAFLRGDGGGGGFGPKREVVLPLPPRTPDRVVEFTTLPNAALLYRLSGDYNPLHADPKAARKAGFERPILHGLCSFGLGCRALLKAYCDNDPSRLSSMFARFSSPVYPGETIRFEFHDIDGRIRFRAVVVERGVVVLDRCGATVRS